MASGFSSDALDYADYDEKKKVLTVTFNNGAVYAYIGVPLRVAKHLLIDASSKGAYFHKSIRSKYECVPVHKTKRKRG